MTLAHGKIADDTLQARATEDLRGGIDAPSAMLGTSIDIARCLLIYIQMPFLGEPDDPNPPTFRASFPAMVDEIIDNHWGRDGIHPFHRQTIAMVRNALWAEVQKLDSALAGKKPGGGGYLSARTRIVEDEELERDYTRADGPIDLTNGAKSVDSPQNPQSSGPE